MKRKICVVTATRAEFGLLYWIIKELEETENIDLQLIVTGAHLSPEFGLTVKNIKDTGLTISKEIEILMSSDTPVGISKSMGLALISFSEAFQDLKPDLLVILGDRYETLAVASAALIARIPIAHIHGGEITEGAIDESIRHALTKLSNIHFTTTDEYKKRVIQLGEKPDTVYNLGAPGIDSIKKFTLLSKEELEKSIDFTLEDKSILTTFHPVTNDNENPEIQFNELLKALDAFPEYKVVFTKANADTNGRIINTLIDEYVSKHKKRCVAFYSLGQLRYLSAIKHTSLVLGNSSSGIIEAPSFSKPSVNIGNRQKGRVKADSVIDCITDTQAIVNAINKALSSEHQELIKNVKNPYGDGNSSKQIVSVLKDINLDNLRTKEFHDLR